MNLIVIQRREGPHTSVNGKPSSMFFGGNSVGFLAQKKR